MAGNHRTQPDFDAAAEASQLLSDVRDTARASAVRTLRRLEQELQVALGAETLKGMKDLRPGHPAARVRANETGTPFEWLPEPKPGEAYGRFVLVVSNRGRLEVARTHRTALGRVVVDVRTARDHELLAEDLESFTSVLVPLLAEHIRRSNASAQKFERVAELASRIEAALADGTRVPSSG